MENVFAGVSLIAIGCCVIWIVMIIIGAIRDFLSEKVRQEVREKLESSIKAEEEKTYQELSKKHPDVIKALEQEKEVELLKKLYKKKHGLNEEIIQVVQPDGSIETIKRHK